MLLLVEPFFVYDAYFVLEFYVLASTFGQCMAMGPYFTWILGMVFWNILFTIEISGLDINLFA